MSSESDQYVYMTSVEPQDNVSLFEEKKYTYVTDSNSNGGTFTSQMQFDLQNLQSNAFIDLKESYIQFPVKLTINKLSDTVSVAPTINAATIKGGFHNFVDSIQIVINGSTVQTSQVYTNIDTTYKVLSEWSQDELDKYGPTLGIALDDYRVPFDTSIGSAESLDNAALKTGTTNSLGWDMTYARNTGFKKRLEWFNNGVSSSNLGRSILGTDQIIAGKGNVAFASSTTAGAEVFCAYILGTIRLKDLSSFIQNMPLCKNVRGFVYVNFNASQHTFTTDATASPNTVLTVSNQTIYGRCAPGMINIGITGGGNGVPAATDGLNLSPSSGCIFKAEISGTTSTLSGVGATYTNARLIAPFYIPSPSVERSLTMVKIIRYYERYITLFKMDKNGNFNGTLTPGLTNAKRLILYPFFTGPGDSGNSAFITNPLLSAADAAPSTTSPFAYIKNLQVIHGNKSIFNQPQNCDADLFLQEISKQGEDGGQNSFVGSGVLNQELYDSLYRYATVDLGRRGGADDGCSKAIQISCTNGTTCPMTVIAIIWYEKEVKIDTASCRIEQTM